MMPPGMPPGMMRPPAPAPPPTPPVYTLTPDATFNVVVRVTKAFDSRRQEEASMMADLIQANPQLITWFGDLFLKNQDGPGHLEMAERAKVMLAPPIQQMLTQQAQGQGAIPPPIAAQMQQLQQRLNDAEKLLQHASQEIQSDNAKYQTELRRTQMELESRERIAALDRETKITVAELGASRPDGAVPRGAGAGRVAAARGAAGHDGPGARGGARGAGARADVAAGGPGARAGARAGRAAPAATTRA
jgi:hypothetical protein